MSQTNTIARTLHDVGAAAWFGGSLMGVTGLHEAAASSHDPVERTRLAGKGWQKWQPFEVAGIAAHLLGGIAVIGGNKGRVTGQKGVMAMTVAKTGVTAAALASTVAAAKLGKAIGKEGKQVPTAGVTDPGMSAPSNVKELQAKERKVQWAVPALTGALIVMSAAMGEQQRPSSVVKGLASRLSATS